VLLGFVPKTDKIQVKEEGSGVDALKDSLSDGSILWAYLRWDSDTLPKFIYISWCGEGVTGTRKAMFMSHSQQMETFFAKSGLLSHVTINARVEADIVEKEIGVKVSKAMGVSYDKAQGDKSRFQQTAEGAGATFKQVKQAKNLVTKSSVGPTKKTEVEIKQDQREEVRIRETSGFLLSLTNVPSASFGASSARPTRCGGARLPRRCQRRARSRPSW
jgi:hypothetical protein